MMVGALNLISVAFAVLFVGIGVDFGIQFSVRYRAERYKEPQFDKALAQAAAKAGRPLALAAAATAAGFYSFLPTDYRGVSELGLIAGTGMFIAFFAAITVLPALLTLLRPPPEQEAVGYQFLAPVDRFMANHRYAIVAGDIACGLGRNAFAPPSSFRFQSAELAQLQGRIRCNLAGFDEGPEHRHQYDRRSRSFSRCGPAAHGAPAAIAGGRPGHEP